MTSAPSDQLPLFADEQPAHNAEDANRNAEDANRNAADRSDQPATCAWGSCQEPGIHERKGELFCETHIYWAVFI